MAWFVKALNKDEKGFTLIELIVVIAILGILAAIAVPRVTNSLSNAKNNANSANLQIVQEAVERYNAENGNYPSSLNDLVPNYLKSIPTLQDGKTFNYDQSSGTVSIK
ncbi:prepilin-type N-terminal cleavage/methylation domain-containing protein [Thermoanaerobacterium sp. PSU-2]|uniref:type II secretion system protein n=1 Tax=Thermoanaerobacterium sp. PSU-2 TaxID=1930849 RepID=UPI000A15AD28|nr:prepilin-type N-terminal cleavage/methylation domain-containing protein [Thermoanaerobacterium sp. PSU-2]ORX22345.1 prepilin-type N-terminal cleavage/methylation domain-containing protein [Thermoanaerobacterium sp. PSU-2]